jgi:hypothetical protein
MLQDSKLGMAIIASVSVIVLVVFSAAVVLDPGSVAIADEIFDFLSSLMERFMHENERQIVENTLTRTV